RQARVSPICGDCGEELEPEWIRSAREKARGRHSPGRTRGHASGRQQLPGKSRPKGLAKGLLGGIPPESGHPGGLIARESGAASAVAAPWQPRVLVGYARTDRDTA